MGFFAGLSDVMESKRTEGSKYLPSFCGENYICILFGDLNINKESIECEIECGIAHAADTYRLITSTRESVGTDAIRSVLRYQRFRSQHEMQYWDDGNRLDVRVSAQLLRVLIYCCALWV